jgi:hypothetical protein
VVLRPEDVFRKIEGLGQFSDGHRDLVTGISASAVSAVFEDLVAKGESLCDAKVEVLEEGRDAGEETDTLDAFGFGLAKDGLDEKTSRAVAFGLGADDDGTYLREVLTVEVQGCAAEKLVSFGFDYGKCADVGADLFIGAAKKGAVVGKALDELVDGVSVLQSRSTRAHEVCFKFDAERNGESL